MIDLESKPNLDSLCLVSSNEYSWTWHKHLAYVNMDLIEKLSKKDRVRRLQKTKCIKDKSCDA